MKKIISSFLVLSCAGVALFYFNSNEKVEIKAESESTTNLKTSTNVSQVITTKVSKSNMIVDLAPPNVISSFAQLLAGMPPHEQEKYLRLNSQLFGALEFSDHKSYQVIQKQGFPSLKDIDYVDQHTREDIGLMLFDNSGQNPTFEEYLSLNLHAVGAVNLIRAIDELEIQTRYYFPEYKQGTRFPSMNEWPDSEYPAQVDEALKRLIFSYAPVREFTAIQYLAKARYEQLSFGKSKNQNNVVVVLTKLALADKKLGGNSNISNYVKQHYPEHIETYANLRNDLL